jgi:diaminobutyrate-2-oxoglutarate transaminase
MFAFEYAGIIPDVILISKAVGGNLPMSVVVYNKKMDVWTTGAHAGTFRGNQMAMVAGTVVMKRLADPKFLAEVVRKGDIVKSRMEKLQKETTIIGDVRGKGLMVGIEFIDPNGPKDIMGHPEPSGEILSKVQRICFANGLIMENGGRYGSVLRCLCALNITDEDLDLGLSIIEKAVKEVDADVRS